MTIPALHAQKEIIFNRQSEREDIVFQRRNTTQKGAANFVALLKRNDIDRKKILWYNKYRISIPCLRGRTSIYKVPGDKL